MVVAAATAAPDSSTSGTSLTFMTGCPLRLAGQPGSKSWPYYSVCQDPERLQDCELSDRTTAMGARAASFPAEDFGGAVAAVAGVVEVGTPRPE